jgi:hypothetical protein
MRSLAPWIALAAAVVCGTACGPSLRRAHRSQVYFERCYSADLDPAVPVDERRACWQQWMAHYHEGQPPDRTDYARERIVRLDPERAEILALATGGGDADPEPEIAAEAAVVAETVAGTAGTDVETPAVGEQDAIASGVGDVSGGGDVTPTGITEPASTERVTAPRVAAGGAGRSGAAAAAAAAPDAGASTAATSASPPEIRAPIPSAAARRAARAVVAPRTDAPHCAAHCEPRWVECSSACTQGDRFACLRACRLQHRTCSRGCY